ncbi:TPA: MBL fold metallo-hydrolase [Streptococcus suis]|nr:MBL fold metallo-hydrolase [Streptococcus suis]HEM4886736.1 MBL fold metallo-hydrolase [Streptococcus suis]
MNCVKREILPVGQGAFYLETLMLRENEYKVIYDCGSATDVIYVETQIKASLNKDEEINAVFISHLDDDHVNGLEFLLKHCNVKNLFFPLITKQTKQFNAIRNLINPQSRFLTQFINSEGNSIRELEGGSEVQLHPISEDASNDNRVIEVTQAIFGAGVEVDWVYLPHNFRERERYQNFISNIVEINSKLSNGGILDDDKIDLEKLKNLWRKGTAQDKKIIKKAYEDIEGTLNINSMTLYSGTKHAFCCRCFHRFYCRYDWECLIRSRNERNLALNGCLYTGDYDLGRTATAQKWQSIYSVYEEYFPNIGLVQIPHHGSKHNYNSKLRDVTEYAVYFASAGLKNSYGHPHKEVMQDLCSYGRIFNCITEDVHSKMTYITRWCD